MHRLNADTLMLTIHSLFNITR